MEILDRNKLALILQKAAETLDIPDHIYEDAVLKYEDVCEHLAADDSELSKEKPEIYPQGSFRLGTVVRPFGREASFDIDLVCRLELKKESISQQALKDRVGDRLRKRTDLAKILNSSRRCWTLDFPTAPDLASFHMDILPSIPNFERQPHAILLTDTKLTKWQHSSPIEYANWFHSRMLVIYQSLKKALAESLKASLDDIPEWKVKTPLQRSVQILKRHRDIYFEGKDELKPVSIIITTLAAHAYSNESNLLDAVLNISRGMGQYIQRQNGKWWVQNPVHPDENYADKWNEKPEKKTAFDMWLVVLQRDLADLSRTGSLDGAVQRLERPLGKSVMDTVARSLGLSRPSMLPVKIGARPTVPELANTSHAKLPLWPVVPFYFARVSAVVYRMERKGGKGKRLWPLSDNPVPKKVWLRFELMTNVPGPYSVQWQVVNTGGEALAANGLRGEFYESDENAPRSRWEQTLYRGTHYVEAFVLKDGACVARSGQVLVRVL